MLSSTTTIFGARVIYFYCNWFVAIPVYLMAADPMSHYLKHRGETTMPVRYPSGFV